MAGFGVAPQHDPGCFRCHGSKLVNAKGDSVQQKCSGACHDVITTDEEKPEAMDVLFPSERRASRLSSAWPYPRRHPSDAR